MEESPIKPSITVTSPDSQPVEEASESVDVNTSAVSEGSQGPTSPSLKSPADAAKSDTNSPPKSPNSMSKSPVVAAEDAGNSSEVVDVARESVSGEAPESEGNASNASSGVGMEATTTPTSVKDQIASKNRLINNAKNSLSVNGMNQTIGKSSMVSKSSIVSNIGKNSMTTGSRLSTVSTIDKDDKKKKKKKSQIKPHVIVEYKGEIDEDRMRMISDNLDKHLDKLAKFLDTYESLSAEMVIKKRKIENETLVLMEQMRDLMYRTVQGDKRELDTIFGGECVKMGKIQFYRERIEKLEFTQQFYKDARWEDLGSVWVIVKEVLESMGRYKKWQPGDDESSEESSSDSDADNALLTEEEILAKKAEKAHKKWVEKLRKIIPTKELTDYTTIDSITSIEELLSIKVGTRFETFDWMAWMVHRVYLNDPTLTALVFTNRPMPLPTDEPRIAPKLVKAVATNTYLVYLLLQNSNLQSQEAEVLSQSLRQNRTIKEVNLENNLAIDVNASISCVDCLAENKSLEVLRLGGQHCERGFGQRFEERLGQAVMRNDSILRIGVDIFNPTWRNQVDRKLIQNNDRKLRAKRKIDFPTQANAVVKTSTVSNTKADKDWITRKRRQTEMEHLKKKKEAAARGENYTPPPVDEVIAAEIAAAESAGIPITSLPVPDVTPTGLSTPTSFTPRNANSGEGRNTQTEGLSSEGQDGEMPNGKTMSWLVTDENNRTNIARVSITENLPDPDSPEIQVIDPDSDGEGVDMRKTVDDNTVVDPPVAGA